MLANNHIPHDKQLNFLKMRVEMIAWRIDELGMTPEIRAALPETTLEEIESLLYATGAPDKDTLQRYEQIVGATEAALSRNPFFWRSGQETLH